MTYKVRIPTMPRKKKSHYIEYFILTQAILHGFFPILMNYSVQKMPPIFFIGITTLLSSLGFILILAVQKKLRELFNKKAFPLIMRVTLFNVILSNVFIFLGTHETSGINTALLLQAEIPLSFLVLGLVYKEKIPRSRIMAGSLVFLGTLLVLYDGQLSINRGDVFIVLGTLFYPFGNHYAKQALKFVSPSTILFMRSLFGGIVLLSLSMHFEQKLALSFPSFKNELGLILIQIFFYLILAKIIWYEGFKRMDITKAISIAMTYPAFSLVFAMIFLKEVPNVYQMAGMALILLSIIFMVQQEKGPKVLHEK